MRNMKSLSSQKVNIGQKLGWKKVCCPAESQNRKRLRCKKGQPARNLELSDKRCGRFTCLRPTSRFAVAIATTVVAVSCPFFSNHIQCNWVGCSPIGLKSELILSIRAVKMNDSTKTHCLLPKLWISENSQE